MSEALDGERAVSEVANKKPWLTTGQKAIGIGVATAVVLGFVFWKNPGGKKEDEPPPPADMGQSVQYEPPRPLPMPTPQAVVPPPQPYVPPAQQQAPQPSPQPITTAASMAVGAKSSRPPRMLSYASDGPAKVGEAGPGASGARTEADGTRVTYKGAEIVGAKAGAAMDMNLLLMPGIIRCVLDTPIDSTLPGPLMCHLSDPVLSSSGVVLMDKGTSIIGQYKNDVAQGQNRLMAVSATAYTPKGIPIPLGGPFADALGRSGLDGNVDNHTMERVGGSVLLSLADGAMGIAQSAFSKGGNSYVSFSSGGGVGSLAQELLRNTINIPPTITKSQGDEVSIWVLTPIDFSAAYKLRTR